MQTAHLGRLSSFGGKSATSRSLPKPWHLREKWAGRHGAFHCLSTWTALGWLTCASDWSRFRTQSVVKRRGRTILVVHVFRPCMGGGKERPGLREGERAEICWTP